MKKVVSIVGGTHGNEYTGVYFLDIFQKRNLGCAYQNLELEFLLANPRAFQMAKRFVDQDLNRSFGIHDLSNFDLSGYEANRAKVINQLLGPKNAARTQFILDLHTTTANMGMTMILREVTPLNYQICSYVQRFVPEAKIYYHPWNGDPNADHPFLNALLDDGICLEVGPIANAVVRHQTLLDTEKVTRLILEALNLPEVELATYAAETLDVYEYVEPIYYPGTENQKIGAFIHQNLQDRDYTVLKKGEPIFEAIDGTVITWDRDGDFYPIFINEAAYYYENKAFSLTRLKTLKKP